MKIIEQFSLIVLKDRINVNDSRHVVEEFKRWCPKLGVLVLKKGVRYDFV